MGDEVSGNLLLQEMTAGFPLRRLVVPASPRHGLRNAPALARWQACFTQLAAPGSVEELAAAIERLLDDPALASRLGTALQQDFEQNRSWEQTAGLILKVCKQILSTNGHK